MFFEFAEVLLSLLIRETARGLLRTYNGVKLFTTDEFASVNRASHRLLIEQRLLKLRRYSSRRRSRSRIPVLLIPPLMVRPDVFDLVPERSLVRALLDQGFDVFLVDLGEPLRRDRRLSMDDYITKRIHRSVRKVKQVTGHQELTLIGYCMGGIFANLYGALYPHEGIRNIINLAAPTDFEVMPGYQHLGTVIGSPLWTLVEQRGMVPASVCQSVFQLSQPLKTLTQPLKLLWNLWNTEYVVTQRAISQWMNNFLNLPEATFKQFWTHIFRENQLCQGTFIINGVGVDFQNIQGAYLALAGESDHLIPSESVFSILDLIGSQDKTCDFVPGGHLGVLVGEGAATTARRIGDWLTPRSRTTATLSFQRATRQPHSKKQPAPETVPTNHPVDLTRVANY